MKGAKRTRIAATESVNYEFKKIAGTSLSGLLPPECKTEDTRFKPDTPIPLSIPEEYHSKMVDHVNVLGIDFYNRECSTATGLVWTVGDRLSSGDNNTNAIFQNKQFDKYCKCNSDQKRYWTV